MNGLCDSHIVAGLDAYLFKKRTWRTFLYGWASDPYERKRLLL